MRSRLALAPRWFLSLLNGVFFGSAMALIQGLFLGSSWIGAIITALFSGTAFGFFMGWFTADRNRRVLELADLANRDELLAAVRASGHGPVPADPRIRSAAARMALNRLREAESQYRQSMSLFAVFVLVYLAMAVLTSPWWLIAAVAFAGLAVQAYFTPNRLARRVVLLGDPEDETVPAQIDGSSTTRST
jgi:hypothetical protein